MAKSRRFSQFKAFILEPILTPSSIFDTGFEESSDGVEEGLGAYDLPSVDTDEIEVPKPVEIEAESVDVMPAEIEVSGLGDEIEIIDYIDPWLVGEQGDYTAGVFTVEDSGTVSIDYLFDGGQYSQGELAIFSLEGMTEEPGSQAFIQEAARRALSSSELGHVVISDATDGALFSTTTSVDFNVGEYQGIQHFKMNPGDRFGFMLAPNHSIQQVYDGEAWRPLFSMATANPDDHFQFGQIADLTGDGTVFSLEDISLASGRSDRDYDDIVFQIRGATGYAPHVEEVIAEGRNIETRLPWDDLIAYVTNPPELDLLAVGDFNVIYSDRFFNPTESFSLIGMVDQVDAVERVEVWVKGFGEDWWRLGDVEDFGAEGHYRFDYGSALDAGHYEVKAIAFYPGGEVETVTPVTVLSLDEGVELSHRVKAALTRSVELGSYDPYALAQTTDWVLSVRSGTDLATLATQLGIAEFEPTGILANTYQVNFESGLSATQVQALINGIESIEYGVPLVREQVYYHSPTNDPLAGNQWYLNQGGIYDAWATHGVSGQGITMGIIDDGFAIAHPDLAANYRADLSWDFDERDNDPSPTYAKTLSLFKHHPDQYYSIFDLPPIPGALHVYNFYRLPFSNVSGTIQDLTLNLSIENDVNNPLKLSLHRYDAGGNLSQPPLNSIVIPSPSSETGSYSINLTEQIQGWSAQGLWAVSIEDLSPYDGNSGFLNELSLDIIALNAHGTAVTGVATAVGDNSIGIVGVAPDAQWAGIRAGVEGIDSLTAARALTHNLDQIDLYNNSWGLGLLVNSFLGIHALEQASRTHGTPYIFSGGNDRQQGYNVNYGTFANSPYTIAVGAVDHTGKVADYSAPGAALFVSAYSSGSDQGVTTTDVHESYRNDFGGTSAAAPVVSGLVALLLEANPDLNWRDIQHILAQSADRTVINDSDTHWSGSEGDAIRHSHDYGFGLVDPLKAVELAKSWEPLNPLITISQGMMVNQMIADYNQSLGLRPVQSTITVEQDITVESVEVLFNGKHGYLGDLEITLISPSGERSVLAEQHRSSEANRRYQNDDDVYFWTFSSFHHWGESSQGNWTLDVVDKRTNSEGHWTNWSLNINGFDPNYITPDLPIQNNNTLAITAHNRPVEPNEIIAASDLFSATHRDGYPILQYRFYVSDHRTGTGYFILDGVEVGNSFTINANQLDDLYFVAATEEGKTQTFSIRAFDGEIWSAEVNAVVNPLPIIGDPRQNKRTEIIIHNRAFEPGEIVPLSTLFTAEDSDNDAMQIYHFYVQDYADNSGYIVVDGVKRNGSVYVNASHLENMQFVASNEPGKKETIAIRAFDGKHWSQYRNFIANPLPINGSAATNRLAVITVNNMDLSPGETVPASTLFSVEDPDGDEMQIYYFHSRDSSSNSGYFSLNGIKQPRTLHINASQLEDLQFVAGSEPGKEQSILIGTFDGKHWANQSVLTINPLT